MGITHEMISNSEGKTSYRVRVDDFKYKMNTWKSGRVIHLKSFKIDGIELRLQLYPNGNERKSENHVSIFVENTSDFGIDLLFDIKMGTKKVLRNISIEMGAQESRGWKQFYRHHDDEYDAADDKDYEITFTVKKLWKQLEEAYADNNNVSDSVLSVEKRMESLEKSMKNLMKKRGEVSCSGSTQRPQIPYPECPICLENLTQDTRIMQCSAGHLICGGCYNNLNPEICPSCKNAIIGRCHGMESYLRTLFATN